MIFTDFYKIERIATKAKSRMDCTFSTHSYPEFEDRAATKATKATERLDATNVGDINFYYHDVPTRFNGDIHRKADKSISIKSDHISSIFVPDVTQNIGYGNYKEDALLFVFHDLAVVNGVVQKGSVIEIFVARGKSNECVPLFEMFSDGELDDELDELRKKATPTNVGLTMAFQDEATPE